MTRRANIFAAMAVLFAVATPAFAAGERMSEGAVFGFMKSGETVQTKITNKAMLDEITHGAIQLDDHAMVVMHDGKLFLVNDHMMSNGKLISDNLAGGHG